MIERKGKRWLFRELKVGNTAKHDRGICDSTRVKNLFEYRKLHVNLRNIQQMSLKL